MPATRDDHKKKDPTSRVTWLVNDNLSAIVELCADVDETILFKRHTWNKPSGAGDFFRFLTVLQRRQWDVVIDAQGLLRSGLCSKFAGNGKNTWGFANAREMAPRFYANRVETPPEKTHAVDRYLHLLSTVLDVEVEYVSPRFKEDEELDGKVDAFAVEHGLPQDHLIAIAVASRWLTKNWPPPFFAKIIDLVRGQLPHHHVWLLGAPTDREIADAVLQHCNGRDRLHDLVGETDMITMIELLRRSDALICNDSGPMHISAAVNTPVFAMFGPTDPQKTGPYGEIHRVFQSDAQCSPCFKRTCPLDQQICYDDVITPEAVAKAVYESLQDHGSDK